jgi:hypothetical protein
LPVPRSRQANQLPASELILKRRAHQIIRLSEADELTRSPRAKRPATSQQRDRLENRRFSGTIVAEEMIDPGLEIKADGPEIPKLADFEGFD